MACVTRHISGSGSPMSILALVIRHRRFDDFDFARCAMLLARRSALLAARITLDWHVLRPRCLMSTAQPAPLPSASAPRAEGADSSSATGQFSYRAAPDDDRPRPATPDARRNISSISMGGAFVFDEARLMLSDIGAGA